MKIKQIAKINGNQDGAIYRSELFRFDAKGNCSVYDLNDLVDGEITNLNPTFTFTLDKATIIAPHSNAVCFGGDFYDKNDYYPLLYTNVYNNYAGSDNKMLGVCLVYRIQKIENQIVTTLVQQIEIGFTEDFELWKASKDAHGVRPYGNFLVDAKNQYYHAFVMRDETLGTRHFKFKLPLVSDGELDGVLSVKKATLTPNDIIESFDLPYQYFIQGGIIKDGKLYSTEGFTNDKINRPMIRVINLLNKTEEKFDIMDMGYANEPEFIDFYGNDCLYSDYHGNLFKIEF
ncbi:MAG: hypothetical protein IKJ14_02440 [Clostridia bacterium]|nr:hypothetical protein [Clostridia bacterium]